MQDTNTSTEIGEWWKKLAIMLLVYQEWHHSAGELKIIKMMSFKRCNAVRDFRVIKKR